MKQRKVGVIGLGGQSAFLKAEHFPDPGETVSCSDLFFELGGKGYNQAVACARMGVKTLFIGAVGDDVNGKLCQDDLEAEQIETCLILKPLPTAYAVITTVADGENTVQVCPGAAKALTADDLRLPAVSQTLQECDMLLLQNELSSACLVGAVELAQEMNIPVVLNPAPAENISVDLLKKCFLITPNYGEAKALAGFAAGQEVSDQELCDAFYRLGLPKAVITMGAKGALVIENGSFHHIPPFSMGKAVDTTGAGDTFNGVLVASLVSGSDLEDACRTAAVASGIGVTRPGARGSIPFAHEVNTALKQFL